MSKSEGNMIVPSEVMKGLLSQAYSKGHRQKLDPLGPDAIRLWAASADFTSDVLIGPNILRPVNASLIKYRTIIKMLLGGP
ncbi:hypothetical protein LB505_008172 [Fusarium chuoi]|nr:hypothetical protein LB505_008172 [Fusarium chuoi]